MTAPSFGSRYLAAIERIAETVTSVDPATPLHACPDWSIHDLVAHLLGLAEDWTLGQLEGYAGDAWTAAQVQRHRASPISTLLAALSHAAAEVAMCDSHPVLGEPARWAFGDALIHEADIYESTGATRPPLDDVLTHLSAGLKRWSPQLAAAAVRLEVLTPQRDWTIGADTDSAIELHVGADAYDIWRAIYGRRTWTQFCGLGWNRTPTEIRDVGLPYPFTFASPTDE